MNGDGAWIEVACGLFIQDSRVLLCRRSYYSLLPGLFEFPGGKRETGETRRKALKRELQEELGIDVHIGAQVSECMLDVDQSFHVTLYHVVERSKCPQLKQILPAHSEMCWADMKFAVRRMPCTPSTYAFYRDVVRFVQHHTVEKTQQSVAR